MSHTHLDAPTIIRHLDGEPVTAEVEAAVEDCSRCAAHLRRLGGLTHALRAYVLEEGSRAPRTPRWDPDFLAAIGVAGPDGGEEPGSRPPRGEASGRRRGRRAAPALGWAAAAVLLLALLAAPSTARLLDGAVAWWRSVAGPGDADPPPASVEDDRTAVGIAVEGDLLRVELEAGSTPGAVIFRRHGGARAVATLSAGAPEAEILARVEGFEVRGMAEADTLEVSVPPSVRTVEVHADTRLLGRYELPAAADASWSLPRRPPGG